jgi:ABC-type methionine transport system ATPase subunit
MAKKKIKPTRKPVRKPVRKPARKARRVKKAKPAKPTKPSTPTQRRLWLMYPPKLIQEPLIWQLGRRFKVVTNIRQASVTDEIGIVCLEVDGKREAVKAAIRWLEKSGVNVEPVEINVIES